MACLKVPRCSKRSGVRASADDFGLQNPWKTSGALTNGCHVKVKQAAKKFTTRLAKQKVQGPRESWPRKFPERMCALHSKLYLLVLFAGLWFVTSDWQDIYSKRRFGRKVVAAQSLLALAPPLSP